MARLAYAAGFAVFLVGFVLALPGAFVMLVGLLVGLEGESRLTLAANRRFLAQQGRISHE